MGVAEASGWYDPAVYPELRSAAPWVMEDMIEAQVMLPEALGDSLASSAPRLVEMLHTAAGAGEPIVVSAVGTSGHSARAVALILNGALGESAVAAGPAEARESADQALAPRRRGLCIAISHGGLSTSTVRALAAAREAGAKTALITAAGNTPARDIADVVLVTPLRDKSYCHTVGYTSPMLTGFYLASAYQEGEFPAAGLAGYLRELLTMRTRALEIGGALGKAERLVAAGSLIDVPTARELALKVAEGAWVPTTVLGVEDTLHGHLVAHDASSALVAVVTGGPGADRAAEGAHELLMAARRIGLQTAAILSPDLEGAILSEDVTAGKLVIPHAALPELVTSLLGGAVALQLLTIGLVHARKTNPDLLRREQAPYREAVAAGRAKHPRR
ncbi:MAG TPA: SIS domain-containing protein [Streptosporangiaceae bacterium]|jgi:fructoselysine-6-P-deglycase FrlB-like protein|nr:SIS domain-containing protein [Streptosporangiaceae bacterium]